MSEPSPSSITIYQLRVVLWGVSPLVWRRLLLASDTSIAELHEIPAFLMEFAGIEGLLRFATTAAFFQRFALSSLEELTSTSFRLIPTKTSGTHLR